DSTLQQLAPRSERLEGMVQAGTEIEALLGAARGSVAPWLHPAGESAPNDIQQQLRQMVVASGSTLVSSQVALEEPGQEGKEGDQQLARIRMSATVSGEWSGLVRLTETLQMHQPPFWVRTVSMVRDGASSGTGPQTARLTLQLEAPLAPQKAKP
ncbi:GspMb/PilO family protein, partial [Verminephrobacter aporrectodeae]